MQYLPRKRVRRRCTRRSDLGRSIIPNVPDYQALDVNGKGNPNCHPFGRKISVFRYERAALASWNRAARMAFYSLPSTSAQMVRPGSYPLMFGWPVWIRVAEVVQTHLRYPDYIMATVVKSNLIIPNLVLFLYNIWIYHLLHVTGFKQHL